MASASSEYALTSPSKNQLDRIFNAVIMDRQFVVAEGTLTPCHVCSFSNAYRLSLSCHALLTRFKRRLTSLHTVDLEYATTSPLNAFLAPPISAACPVDYISSPDIASKPGALCYAPPSVLRAIFQHPLPTVVSVSLPAFYNTTDSAAVLAAVAANCPHLQKLSLSSAVNDHTVHFQSLLTLRSLKMLIVHDTSRSALRQLLYTPSTLSSLTLRNLEVDDLVLVLGHVARFGSRLTALHVHMPIVMASPHTDVPYVFMKVEQLCFGLLGLCAGAALSNVTNLVLDMAPQPTTPGRIGLEPYVRIHALSTLAVRKGSERICVLRAPLHVSEDWRRFESIHSYSVQVGFRTISENQHFCVETPCSTFPVLNAGAMLAHKLPKELLEGSRLVALSLDFFLQEDHRYLPRFINGGKGLEVLDVSSDELGDLEMRYYRWAYIRLCIDTPTQAACLSVRRLVIMRLPSGAEKGWLKDLLVRLPLVNAVTIGLPVLVGNRRSPKKPIKPFEWNVLDKRFSTVRVVAFVGTCEIDTKHDAVSITSFFAALRTLARDVGRSSHWAVLESLHLEAYLSHHDVHLAVTKHTHLVMSTEKAVLSMQRLRPQLKCETLMQMFANLKRARGEVQSYPCGS